MAVKKFFDSAVKNWAIIITALFLAATVIYVCIYREGIYLQVHDNLDSNIATYKMMKDSGLFWSVGKSAPFLGGINRNYIGSDLSAYMWLYMFLSPLAAIIAGWYLKILMSICGFVLLGKTIYNEMNGGVKSLQVFIFCGLIYGICPTFPTVPFSFASLPLLLTLLIKLYRKFEWRYMLLLLLYPVLSDFALFGIFICGYVLAFFIIDLIYHKRPAWRFAAALVILSAGYIIVNWRLFQTILFSSEPTLRNVSYVRTTISWQAAFNAMLHTFRYGYYHCASSHSQIVFPVCMLYFAYLNFTYIKNRQWHKIFTDAFNLVMFMIMFNCVIYGVSNVQVFITLISIILPPLKGLGFARTLWFNAFLWYFAFMIVLCRLNFKWNTVFRFILLILAFVSVCRLPDVYNHIRVNAHKFLYDTFKIERYKYSSDLLSYGEFYSPKLFERIKHDINYNGEWSIAFGMHPAVLQYNGIAILDGYLSYYSEKYKQQFRRLIEPDLNIDTRNQKYFDNWGGRAYVFSNEVSYQPDRVMNVTQADMLINPQVFREMGGRYVFSRVKINNAPELGLTERGIYDMQEDSPYTIYVYEAK